MAAGTKRKRKAISQRLESATYSADFIPGLKHDQVARSLLDLPPELRNVVYEPVLDDASWFLPRSGRGFGKTSVLARVNEQIQSEFLSASISSADIHLTVHSVDFGHVIAFMNRLSVKGMDSLPSAPGHSSTSRPINVNLIAFTDDDDHDNDSCVLILGRWFRRAENPG
ncbi:hypothetical protein EJ03DRAFT_355219 [Teratosphaeria nubilosa]|uniref:Uncharacterized protein n=1 Tax=Teratosphaeria nubilosa TaxID=161662 RepID=A0A6G1KWN6_9PEZI|nr:hypothetical protein EJ03DRAFT_355219 [Teratosphaeria nubilosa]